MKLSCFEVNFVDLLYNGPVFLSSNFNVILLGRVVRLMWPKSFHLYLDRSRSIVYPVWKSFYLLLYGFKIIAVALMVFFPITAEW